MGRAGAMGTLVSRRAALLGAAALGGCATTSPAGGLLSEPLQREGPLRLAPVIVQRERVIRTIAGLRPYRPAGFVVRTERHGDKSITHNYGHGGGGITLSWGSSALAVREGFDSAVRDYAVLGAGVMGLSCARLLQQRGARVTIYARDLPPDTTSNVAGAQWWPTSVYSRAEASAEFLAQFAEAARLSYHRFQLMVGSRYGVRWTRNYIVSDNPISPDDPIRRGGPLEGLAPEVETLAPGEHPFGHAHVKRYTTMMIEPSIYLDALLADFLHAGGRIQVAELRDRADVLALPEARIFNCTGLGARALFGDEALIPAKGQLVFLLPQPEVTYNVLGPGTTYMFPRRDGILLGGSFERNNWDLAPDPAVTEAILARHQALFARMRPPNR